MTKRIKLKPGLKRTYIFLIITAIAFLGVLVNNTGDRLKQLVNNQHPKFGTFTRIEPNSYPIPIIAYHYVEVVTDDRDFIRKNLAINPSTFEQQLTIIESRKYETVFVKQIPSLLANSAHPKNLLALTFDDGYADFYTDAFPLLKKFRMKATIYIIPGFIGYQNYMTEAQIKEVLQSGLIEIGAHTMRHYQLPIVKLELARAEINNSKTVLEKMFGVKVVSFAYPSGFYNQAVANEVKNAGFTNAVTMDKGSVQNESGLFTLKRIRVGDLSFDSL